ncbi:MAG: hypothetical protein ACXAEI_20610 [Candidatus Hodarchaeales archaeon]|jgi:hypothetical protein
MPNSKPHRRNDKDNDFQRAKHYLATRRLKKKSDIFQKKKQLIAIHLFRALDDYNIRGKKTNQVRVNEEFLRTIQNSIYKQKIDVSLRAYSEGVILGALANLLRRFEANIRAAKKYERVLGQLKAWQEMGVSDEISDYLKDSVAAAEELLGWTAKRTQELRPIGLEILDLVGESEDSPDEILVQLSQKTDEKEVFYFLAGCLQTNKDLFEQIKSDCRARQKNVKESFLFLEKLMVSLQSNAKNQEVQGLAKMFLEGYKHIN